MWGNRPDADPELQGTFSCALGWRRVLGRIPLLPKASADRELPISSPSANPAGRWKHRG